ncbi:phosphopantetheine-binding protein [Parvibium lacunae]|uniref:Acyl carrier protein n=1 Tax=Parvibium lacunae TaxID=1888893 RepID=A0A368L1S5_9BURK|nr:phosphopantetheine-binding protein [Parvibium lacunae]RCS57507.1 acyl carrier protein [Parvibium lacunae]
MDTLETQIKAMLIETLDLEELTPDQIADDLPLFGEGLGLDSIDALELGVALRKQFQVSLEANNPNNKQYFYSVRTLANLVRERGVFVTG